MLCNLNYAIYMSDRSHDNVIGFHIEGTIHQEDLQRYRRIVEGTTAQFDDVRLLICFDNNTRSEVTSAWEALLPEDRLDRLQRIALIGKEQMKEWAKAALEVPTGLEIRFYSTEEYEEAWEWLEGAS
jgi:hypothetical protein